ncbi:hypothetical protein Vretifemale_20898 [Volvox reticuliferus]|uniref:Uncharacterized protein n=1 Tax=Volvox reticuliferus TaxID=1737510 RepID=A0A8J4G232_9CHLO|nr:hypothetical protein Vretifemale_20898 [Volvox reticuliferus]
MDAVARLAAGLVPPPSSLVDAPELIPAGALSTGEGRFSGSSHVGLKPFYVSATGSEQLEVCSLFHSPVVISAYVGCPDVNQGVAPDLMKLARDRGVLAVACGLGGGMVAPGWLSAGSSDVQPAAQWLPGCEQQDTQKGMWEATHALVAKSRAAVGRARRIGRRPGDGIARAMAWRWLVTFWAGVRR